MCSIIAATSRNIESLRKAQGLSVRDLQSYFGFEEPQTIYKWQRAPMAPLSVKTKIEQDIKMLQAGIYGEEAIAFELKNSHIPMLVLHDLNLKHQDLSGQIDYLIVTRKRIFVLEFKNLIGNIEVSCSGDFIRSFSYGGRPRVTSKRSTLNRALTP